MTFLFWSLTFRRSSGPMNDERGTTASAFIFHFGMNHQLVRLNQFFFSRGSPSIWFQFGLSIVCQTSVSKIVDNSDFSRQNQQKDRETRPLHANGFGSWSCVNTKTRTNNWPCGNKRSRFGIWYCEFYSGNKLLTRKTQWGACRRCGYHGRFVGWRHFPLTLPFRWVAEFEYSLKVTPR